jgi:mono/diheme cytochrome c family protein
MFFVFVGVAIGCALWVAPGLTAKGEYVGSKACADCHAAEFENFSKYAKKAKSDHSIKIMAEKLTPEELKSCYACHTTGYGKPGGFRSFQETPQLAHAGCEVCHGPGADHVEANGDPKLIKRQPLLKECEVCHNEERVKSFNFKPLLHGGAH